MFPLLAIPLLLGWVVARHWLDRREWPELIGASVAVALVTSLVGVNFLYRKTTIDYAVAFTLTVQFVALILLWKKRPPPAPVSPIPRWSRWSLVALSLVVGLYANAQQIANPDDDYWIHAPLQGLMRHGNFPPFHPYFSDIPMNGHYGRDLAIAVFSYLSGLDVFMSQHLLTSLLQVLTLWLFYSAFYVSSGSRLSALLGTVFVFFGINAGGRGGLVDTMQNNNAFVHFYLAFLLLLTVEAWRRGGRALALTGGLTLGSYAVVYETHFGLVFLTILGVTPILKARGLIDRRGAVAALAILLLSLPLAFTQGGPLTDLLDRKLANRSHSQAEQLSRGMQNQAQVVKITFPKKELFQILLETGEYQRVAEIYRLDTPLKFLYRPSEGRGYAYIWSWDVLRLHFLPLYLVPFSAFLLWRQGSLGGLFMGAFGTISFLVPALVHFGPIYESEYYRWEFAAALGFAGALGLALAGLAERGVGRPFLLDGTDLVISPKGKRLILIALITLVNCWASLTFVGARFSASFGPNLKAWLVFPTTRSWLASHAVLDFHRVDYEAAAWLEERVLPGDRMLVNFREENNVSILYESTLSGLSGARCVGHALPLEQERIGTTPFRRNAAAQLFWESRRADALAQLQVDWLFYRTDAAEEAPSFPGATLLQTFQEGNQVRLIYKVDRALLPQLQRRPSEAESGRAATLTVPEPMRGGYVAPLTLEGRAEPQALYTGTLELSTVRLSDGLVSPPMQNLLLHLEGQAGADGWFALEVPFVPPREEGEYRLEARFYPHETSFPFSIAAVEIRSGFTSLLEEVTLTSWSLPPGSWGEDGTAPPRAVLTPNLKLDLPDALPHPRTVLAGWAFYSVERERYDVLPGINLKEVELRPELSEPAMVTPERPGRYRLALFLSAGPGHLFGLPAGLVTVSEESSGE